jgi:DNA-binding response OmpR family regulator
MHAPILLVDDDEFARGFARAVLQRAGFVVHEAEGVADALAAAREHKPGVVVTDWNLPDGDGGGLARSLHAAAARLPVILITGDASAADSRTGVAAEFAAIISKPFRAAALETAVRAAAGR